MKALDILKTAGVYSESEYNACLDQDEKAALHCRVTLVEIMEGVRKAELVQSPTPSQLATS